MSVALSTIRTQIRSNLDETTASDWTDAELNRVINQRYHRVHSAVVSVYNDYKITTATTNLVANQQEYSLPSDFFKLRRVEVNYDITNINSVFQKASPLTSLEAIRSRVAETNISDVIFRNPMYYLTGAVLGLLPIPTSAGANALKLWYIPTLPDLTADTSTLDIPYPERYWHIIAEGGTADALRFGQQDSVEADKFDQKFIADILLMQEELQERVADDAKFVIDSSGDPLDFGGGWY
jgi:hypothetical protein